MAGIFSKNIATTILQNDPVFPDYLNFDQLRKEGLEHIGQLAGKIWTDHNVHDPGITILEVLIYALMDLGYKTNLPFEDLVAMNKNQKEDNFLTPLDILTINPVTILDYRKLLLECPGVANVWLEPVTQEVDLAVLQKDNGLVCNTEYPREIRDGRNHPFYSQLHLNGLYKIFIEKEASAKDAKLKKRVRKLWSKYRNLCEDLVDITILEPLEFGVCANVEISTGIDPSRIYKAIIIAIRDFIQPQIKYHTLEEMLDKGKSIDDIFAGRPYLEESIGFVDTEELEAIKRRKAIYLSDFYNVILSVDGVQKIKSIRIDGGTVVNKPSYDWIEGQSIRDDQVPVFSLDKTCVDLYRANGLLNIEKNKIHATLPLYNKFLLSPDKLNGSVPSGKYHEDLSRYYSIQNDFPVVYGIGENGLPDHVSLDRKTQAFQLKGYLLFYDQLLANYTAQLSNFRSLFSLKPENDRTSGEKKTYFSKVTDTVPGLEKLLKFYEKNSDMSPDNAMARPIANDENWQKMLELLQTDGRAGVSIKDYCGDQKDGLDLYIFSSSTVREIYIDQLKESFSHGEYDVTVHSDKYGYFFVLHPSLPKDLILVGSKKHKAYGEAVNEAGDVAFIASFAENYTRSTDKSVNSNPDRHYFGLKDNPLSYLSLIGKIVEGGVEYEQRRQKMLDHLLARFGEDFTDYTLLKYRQNIAPEELRQITLDDQSTYLANYAELSRDRGKAFDYLQPSWNTANVSGFEKRLSKLAGIENYDRRNLCNIEVSPCYELQLKDEQGNILLEGKRSYESEQALRYAAGRVLNSLKNPTGFEELKRITTIFNSNKAVQLFSDQPRKENIFIAKYRHQQQLLDINGGVVATGKNTRYDSVEAAEEEETDFIENINEQNLVPGEYTGKGYDLRPVSGQGLYLDITPFDVEIIKHPFWKWQYEPPGSEEIILSEDSFATKEGAWQDMTETSDTRNSISEFPEAFSWKASVNEEVILVSKRLSRSNSEAEISWDFAEARARSEENYSVEKSGESSYRIILHGEEAVIAVSEVINLEVLDPEAAITVSTVAFSEGRIKPDFSILDRAFGFQIPAKNSFPTLESYHLYPDLESVMEAMQKAYILGTSKTNYQEYNQAENSFGFNLLLEPELILLRHKISYETGKDRDRALNSALRFFKKEKPPFSLQKQHNKYTWKLIGEWGDLISSDEEFSSNPKARANFKENLLKEAAEKGEAVFGAHLYHFEVNTQPSQYKFVYGLPTEDEDFQPLFISGSYFFSPERANTAYSQFVNKIHRYSFKKVDHKDFDYALYEGSSEKPVAIQFQTEHHQAPVELAEPVVSYFREMYDAGGDLNPAFFTKNRKGHRTPLFKWKFFKKDDPLAINPYRCREIEDVREFGKLICDRVPSIDMRYCPPKDIVICPDKDPEKYHYQLCFQDKNDLEFRLISNVGYDSEEEARDAWVREWYGLLLAAKDPEEYGAGGKISLTETYKPDDDKACDDASFLAVIPSRNSSKLAEAGKDVIGFYSLMARLFPIYEVKKKDKRHYKFKVVIPEDGLGPARCDMIPPEVPYDDFGSVVWLGTGCYSSYAEVIKAYNHFYVLAGISQNCRVMCDLGWYYLTLTEVWVESSCNYPSEAEAWDDAFASLDANGNPIITDGCGDCKAGGVRSFLYAGDDPKNYIPVCKDGKWTFKVVAPDYFVARHACSYDSEKEAHQAMKDWEEALKNLDWSRYLNFISASAEIPSEEKTEMNFLSAPISTSEKGKWDLCDLVFALRKCLGDCPQALLSEEELSDSLKMCLNKICKGEKWVHEFLKRLEEDPGKLIRLINYFPVYLDNDAQCYRIYWPDHDQDISANGLQPCGCEEEPAEENNTCDTKFPILSSRCFKCCEEAWEAFQHLSRLIKNGAYVLECTQRSDYGPYSFQMLDPGKELGYHPQSYDSYQEVLDAITLTRGCVENMGMHLLEHILLRPKTLEDCRSMNRNDNRIVSNCLLPICPDYCCPINWHPDIAPDDPCAEDNPDVIQYLPGNDPYSFWATLVLPSWAKGFRSTDARKVFEQLIYKEIPALVGLNILWLSPRDMCRFESEFKNWLGWLQNPQEPLCNPDGRHPHCLMVDCIKDLQSEPACPAIPGVGGNCNCGVSKEEIDPCCLPPETSGTVFWGYCPPGDLESVAKPEPEDPVVLLLYSKGEDNEVLRSQIKDRNYLFESNLDQLVDEDRKKTKSFKRTLSFIKSTPAIPEYVKLVDFFNRYSLNKSANKEMFLGLLQNATVHLFAGLVLEYDDGIPEKELEILQESINVLAENGLSGTELKKSWNPSALDSMAYTKTLNQINKILNTVNGQ